METVRLLPLYASDENEPVDDVLKKRLKSKQRKQRRRQRAKGSSPLTPRFKRHRDPATSTSPKQSPKRRPSEASTPSLPGVQPLGDMGGAPWSGSDSGASRQLVIDESDVQQRKKLEQEKRRRQARKSVESRQDLLLGSGDISFDVAHCETSSKDAAPVTTEATAIASASPRGQRNPNMLKPPYTTDSTRYVRIEDNLTATPVERDTVFSQLCEQATRGFANFPGGNPILSPVSSRVTQAYDEAVAELVAHVASRSDPPVDPTGILRPEVEVNAVMPDNVVRAKVLPVPEIHVPHTLDHLHGESTSQTSVGAQVGQILQSCAAANDVSNLERVCGVQQCLLRYWSGQVADKEVSKEVSKLTEALGDLALKARWKAARSSTKAVLSSQYNLRYSLLDGADRETKKALLTFPYGRASNLLGITVPGLSSTVETMGSSPHPSVDSRMPPLQVPHQAGGDSDDSRGSPRPARRNSRQTSTDTATSLTARTQRLTMEGDSLEGLDEAATLATAPDDSSLHARDLLPEDDTAGDDNDSTRTGALGAGDVRSLMNLQLLGDPAFLSSVESAVTAAFPEKIVSERQQIVIAPEGDTRIVTRTREDDMEDALAVCEGFWSSNEPTRPSVPDDAVRTATDELTACPPAGIVPDLTPEETTGDILEGLFSTEGPATGSTASAPPAMQTPEHPDDEFELDLGADDESEEASQSSHQQPEQPQQSGQAAPTVEVKTEPGLVDLPQITREWEQSDKSRSAVLSFASRSNLDDDAAKFLGDRLQEVNANERQTRAARAAIAAAVEVKPDPDPVPESERYDWFGYGAPHQPIEIDSGDEAVFAPFPSSIRASHRRAARQRGDKDMRVEFPQNKPKK